MFVVFYEQSDNLTVYKYAYKLHERIQRYFFNKKETELYSNKNVAHTTRYWITFIRYAQSKNIIKHDSHISTIFFLNVLILLIGYFFGW